MRRDTFLKRVGLVLGGVAVGRHVQFPEAMPVEMEATAVRVTALSDSLVASGGLCAPLSPIYDMPSFAARPVREALPMFRAVRGGITSPQ